MNVLRAMMLITGRVKVVDAQFSCCATLSRETFHNNSVAPANIRHDFEVKTQPNRHHVVLTMFVVAHTSLSLQTTLCPCSPVVNRFIFLVTASSIWNTSSSREKWFSLALLNRFLCACVRAVPMPPPVVIQFLQNYPFTVGALFH